MNVVSVSGKSSSLCRSFPLFMGNFFFMLYFLFWRNIPLPFWSQLSFYTIRRLCDIWACICLFGRKTFLYLEVSFLADEVHTFLCLGFSCFLLVGQMFLTLGFSSPLEEGDMSPWVVQSFLAVRKESHASCLVPSLLICGAGVCPLPLDPGQANGHMSCAKAVQLQPVARAQARIQKKSLEPKAEERPKDWSCCTVRRLCLLRAQSLELVAAALAANRAAELCRRKAAVLPCFSPRKSSSRALQLLRKASRQLLSPRGWVLHGPGAGSEKGVSLWLRSQAHP